MMMIMLVMVGCDLVGDCNDVSGDDCVMAMV